MRAEDKERAIAEVVARVLAHAGDPRGLDAAIADTIYHERSRLEKERRSKEREAALHHWDDRRRALLDAGTTDAVSSQPKALGILVTARLPSKCSSQPRAWLMGKLASSTP